MPVKLDRSTGETGGKQDKKPDVATARKKRSLKPPGGGDKKKQVTTLVLLGIITASALGFIGWQLLGSPPPPHDIPMRTQRGVPQSTTTGPTAQGSTARRSANTRPISAPNARPVRPAGNLNGFANPLEGEPTGRQKDEMSGQSGIH